MDKKRILEEKKGEKCAKEWIKRVDALEEGKVLDLGTEMKRSEKKMLRLSLGR